MTDKKRYLEAFGKKIIALRTEKGISFNDLSEKSGIDIDTLRAIEAGKYDLDLMNLFDIANVFAMEPKELI